MTKFRKSYEVNTNQANSNKRLGLIGLLEMLQDIAGIHADELGFGYEQMMKSQTFWVLTRQNLVMKHWPKWRDVVDIYTWARPLKGPIATRDFEIVYEGELVGECTTSWMILDGQTRKPKAADFDTSSLDKNMYKVSIETGKVPPPKDPMSVMDINVRISDLDMNNHVNNTKYGQWILDAIDYEYHKTMFLKQYEINFLAETHLGDQINLQKSFIENTNSNKHVIYQGVRKSDEKVVFTAKILAEKK